MSRPAPAVGDAVEAKPQIVSVAALSRGTGRTSTVVNLAVLLALAGRRVLIVGLDPEPPNLSNYLSRLRISTVPSIEAADRVLGRELTRFIANEDPWPARTSPAWECGLPQTPASFRLLETTLPGAPGERARRLRTALLSAPVDFVLVDHPRQDFDSTVADVRALCDVAAVAYQQSDAPSGARLLRRIGAGSSAPALIALETFVSPGTRIEDVVTRAGIGCDAVAVPPAPAELRDHQGGHLSVLVDDPAKPDTELAAYRRIAGLLTHDETEIALPFSDRVRNRYRRVIGLENSPEETAVIRYEPADRPYVDWLRHELELAAFRVIATKAGSPAEAELVISVLDRSMVGPPGPADPAREVLRVRFTPPAVPTSTDPPEVLDLTTGDEIAVRGRLIQQGLIVGAESGPDAPRFPRGHAPTGNPLPPVRWFVGRGPELEALRDQLLTATGPVLVRGPAGRGKSELVREYARRFGYDHDIVWWINAETPAEIRNGLAELADKLLVPRQGNAAQAALQALADLSWLVIFDNADDLGMLEGFLPSSPRGRVVITTRTAADDDQQLAELTDDESLAYVAGALAGIPVTQARELIDAVGRAPIDLQLAVSEVRQSAWSAQRRKAELESESLSGAVVELVDTLDDEPPGAIGPLTAVLDELGRRELGACTIGLAELCSFMSAEHLSLELLTSPGMVRRLIEVAGESGTRLAADGSELQQVIRLGVRFGLFELDWRQNRVRMHRAVQDAIRGRMTEAEAQLRREQVLRALAAFAPSEAGLGTTGRSQDLGVLAPHIHPSGAAGSELGQVRRWLLQHVRREYLEGDRPRLAEASELAGSLLRRWAGEQPVPDQEQPARIFRARLQVQLANIERAQGHAQAALGHDEDARRVLSSAAGPDHPRTLAAARGIGGDLRTLGRFGEGLDEDEGTHLGYRRIFGDEHPETMMAAHNLGLSMYLNGDPGGALNLAGIVTARWALLFEPDHPLAVGARIALAQYQREVGARDEAKHTLAELAQAVPADGNPALRLGIARQRAILDRTDWYVVGDGELILAECQALFGDQHPMTLAAQASLALDLYAVTDSNRAINVGREALLGYQRWLGGAEQFPERAGLVHPFVSLCKSNLGVLLRAGGLIESAVDQGRQAHQELLTSLEAEHPWTVAAASNLAGHSFAAGRRAEARQALTDAHSDFAYAHDWLDVPDRRRAPVPHPYLGSVERNLAILDDESADAGQAVAGWQNLIIDLPET